MPRDDPDDYAIKVSQWETLTFDHINLAGDTPQVYRFWRPEEGQQLVETPDDVEASKFSGRQTSPETDETLPRRGSRLVDNDLWEDDDVAHGMARDGYYMTPNEGGVYDVCGGPGQKEEDGAPCLLRSSSFDASLLASHNTDLETHTIKERLKGYVRQQSNGY